MRSLLIVDDNPGDVKALRQALRHSYNVRAAHTKAAALEELATPPDAVLLDVRLSEQREDRDGLALLEILRRQLPHVPVVMITGHADKEIVIECLRLDATEFVEKAPGYTGEVALRLQTAFGRAREQEQKARLEQERKRFAPGDIIGQSALMQEMKELIADYAADGNVTVLVRGEPGTGKELVAGALHKNGPRRDAPFKDINLSALSTEILESEVFGHEKGAFTGADDRKFGLLDQVRGGVLFLDEIGEITESLQVKLLRVLQEREFQRMGGVGKTVKFDAQIVVATNADLEQKIRDRQFRQDFYDRLNVAQIAVPPLRDRAGDIPLLVEHFLELQRLSGKRIEGVAPDAMQLLLSYKWPGNVRELKNVIEGAAPIANRRQSPLIEAQHLRADVRATASTHEPFIAALQTSPLSPQVAATQITDGFDIKRHLAQQELLLISQALKQCNGFRAETAALLGYGGGEPRFALRDKLKQHKKNFPDLIGEFPDLYAT